MDKELKYYDQKGLWGRKPATYQEQTRADILKMLPPDIRSVLDVGCGDGFITNSLPEALFRVGLDISVLALRYVNAETILASSSDLPFARRAFDLVMVNDVLEHLPEARYGKACSELQRVAGKYLLVSVPFMENLKAHTTCCSVCGYLYHLNHHQRAYDFKRLRKLFGDFVLDHAVLSGEEWHDDLNWVVSFMQKAGQYQVMKNTVCPQCEAQDAATSGFSDHKLLAWCRKRQAWFLSSNPRIMDMMFLRTELIALFRRADQVSHRFDRSANRRWIDAQEAKVKAEPVWINKIDFQRHNLYLMPHLPRFSRLPCFVTNFVPLVGPSGITCDFQTKEKPWELKTSFFLPISGSACYVVEGSTGDAGVTLNLSGYDDYHGYQALGARTVVGDFRVEFGIDRINYSQYGLLFNLRCGGSRLSLRSISLEGAAEVPCVKVFGGGCEYLRRELGETPIDLSTNLYGDVIPYPLWFDGVENLTVENFPASSFGSEETFLFCLLLQKLSETEQKLSEIEQKLSETEQILSETEQKLSETEQKVVENAKKLTVALEIARQRSGKRGALREFLNLNDNPCNGSGRLMRFVKHVMQWRRSIPPAISNSLSLGGPAIRLQQKTVTMIVPDDRIDRRVLLEARSLVQAGWRAVVVAAPRPSENYRVDEESFPEVQIVRIDPSHAVTIPPEMRVDLATVLPDFRDWREFYWYHYHFLLEAIRHPSEIVVAHDLPVLPAAAGVAHLHGARLVYDAHELYPEQAHFGAKRTALYRDVESLLIHRAHLVTTVNQSIAEEMAKCYGIRMPEVILNAPDVQGISSPVPRSRLLHDSSGIAESLNLLLFQGSLSLNRNLENLVQAVSLVQHQDVGLILMGPDGGIRQQLLKIARDFGLLDRRVFFHEAVPPGELLRYTAAADAGIIPYPHVDLNSTLCSPNKLFEYIVAELPILANDSPELRRFVGDQGVGIVYPMRDAGEIAAAIDTFFNHDLGAFRKRLREISSHFVWSIQGKKLVELYAQVRNQRRS
jgi:glycosyltransferase involved in cell wall biosynthesis/SAM-dependent methyltransferase